MAFTLLPLNVQAISLTYTAFIGASNTTCTQDGYISPSTDTRNAGDVLTINFKNEKTLPLQMRGIAGGNFNVSGNTTVTKTFTTNETINYSIWLTDGSCQKASAVINVSPAPSSPVPSSSPTPTQSSTPTPSQTPTPTEPSEQTTAAELTDTATPNEPAATSKPSSSFIKRWWWLPVLLLLVLAALLAVIQFRQKKK